MAQNYFVEASYGAEYGDKIFRAAFLEKLAGKLELPSYKLAYLTNVKPKMVNKAIQDELDKLKKEMWEYIPDIEQKDEYIRKMIQPYEDYMKERPDKLYVKDEKVCGAVVKHIMNLKLSGEELTELAMKIYAYKEKTVSVCSMLTVGNQPILSNRLLKKKVEDVYKSLPVLRENCKELDFTDEGIREMTEALDGNNKKLKAQMKEKIANAIVNFFCEVGRALLRTNSQFYIVKGNIKY
jgi:uncharacterized protein with HEPN domain